MRLFVMMVALSAAGSAQAAAQGLIAQKAQAEYQKLADKIGFKECGGGT